MTKLIKVAFCFALVAFTFPEIAHAQQYSGWSIWGSPQCRDTDGSQDDDVEDPGYLFRANPFMFAADHCAQDTWWDEVLVEAYCDGTTWRYEEVDCRAYCQNTGQSGTGVCCSTDWEFSNTEICPLNNQNHYLTSAYCWCVPD